MDQGQTWHLFFVQFLLPVTLIFCFVHTAWGLREALRTGRAEGRAGVVYREDKPGLFWTGMTFAFLFLFIMLGVTIFFLQHILPLQRIILLVALLSVCFWQGWPYLRENVWGKMPGDFHRTYWKEEDFPDEEALAEAMANDTDLPSPKGLSVTVLHPWGSVILTSFFILAIFHVARYLG